MGKFTQKWYGKKWVKILIYLTGLQGVRKRKGSLKAPETHGVKDHLEGNGSFLSVDVNYYSVCKGG
jgi:hypothetical protein